MANPYEPPTHEPDPQPEMAGEDYEFDNLENVAIDKFGRRARLWGIISYLGAALMTLALLFFFFGASAFASTLDSRISGVIATALGGVAVFLIITTIVYAVMGKLYTDAGSSLQRVVVSTDNDVFHMMQALKRLGTAFQIEAALVILSTAITLIVQHAGIDFSAWGGR